MKESIALVVGLYLLVCASYATACSITSGYELGTKTWESPSGHPPGTPVLRLLRIDRGEPIDTGPPCGFYAIIEIAVESAVLTDIAGYYIRVTGSAPSGMYVPDGLLLPRTQKDGTRVFWFSWPEIVKTSHDLSEIRFTLAVTQVSTTGSESEAAEVFVEHRP